MINIFNNKDIVMEISNYLKFDDKVKLSNALNIRLTKFYDFRIKNFMNKRIEDIFNESKSDDFCDYITEWISMYSSQIEKYYVIYLYADDLYSDSDSDNYFNSDSESDNETESDNENNYETKSDSSDTIYRKINNCYDLRYTMVTKNTEFILSTIFNIYPRKIIELIEENNLVIKYDPNIKLYELAEQIEDILEISIDEKIIDYYKYIFKNNYQIDIFCKRC